MVVELSKKTLLLLPPSPPPSPSPSFPLNAALWSRLPSHLLDEILARLPLISFLTLRLVCKRWNSLASSPAFLRLCSSAMPSTSCLLFFADATHCSTKTKKDLVPSGCAKKKHPALSYIHILRACNCLIITEMPVDNNASPVCSNIKRGISLDFLPNPYRIKVLSAAAGLVLCSVGAQCVLVCNPLTKAWRPLPPIVNKRYPLLTAIVGEAGGYKVVFAAFKGSGSEGADAYIYDSRSRDWHKSENLKRPVDHYPRFFIGRAAQCNGMLYWVAPEFDGTLITFHVKEERWGTIETRWENEGFRWPHWPQLVEYRGMLLMVGVVGKEVIAWQLEREKGCWKETGRVNERISRIFCNNLWGLECGRVDDSIYVTAYNKPGILLYNLSTTKSQWFPCQNEAHPFSFQPRLDAFV